MISTRVRYLGPAAGAVAAALMVLPAGCASNAERVELHSASGAYLAGRFAAQQRELDSAAELFALAAAEHGGELLTERAFYQALAAGHVDQADRLARDLLDGEQSHKMAQLVLAASYFRQGDYEATRGLLATADLGPVNGALGELLTAWSYAGEGRADEALDVLGGAGITAFSMFHGFHKALINEFAGRPEAAREAYEAALGGGAAGFVHDAYGQFLERNGEPGEARAFYERMLDLAPSQIGARAALKRIDKGEAPPPMVRNPRDGAATAFLNIAGALASERTFEPPLIYVNYALSLSPDYDRALALKGELLQTAELWREAGATFLQIKPSSPYYDYARMNIANSLDQLDDTDAAIALLRDLIKDGVAESQDAALFLGDLLQGEERWREAGEMYAAVIAVLPTPEPASAWRVYYSRGVSYERDDQWALAEADFKHALTLSPDQPFVLNYLGYSWADRNENLLEAFEMLEKAVELRPYEGAIADSLGWAHYRLGRYDDALEYIQRAVELTPDDATITDHLGDVYWRLDRRAEAQFEWRRAIELDPEDDLLDSLRDKLENGLADADG